MRRSSNFGFDDEVESIALNDASPGSPSIDKSLPPVPFPKHNAKKYVSKPQGLRVSQISQKRSSQTSSPLRKSFMMESESESENESEYRDSFMSSMTADSDAKYERENLFEDGRDSWQSSNTVDSDVISFEE
jgi:hypothetical protein